MENGNEPLGIFEKYLTLWIGLSIGIGITAGYLFPDFFNQIAKLEISEVNIIVAIVIWLMIFPMMVNIDYSSIASIKNNPKGILVTLIVNWGLKPFSMALIGILFFEYIYSSWINPELAKQYLSGIILLGVAPCTAMVFIWSQMTNGDPYYTLVQVSINDLIMMVAFAPIAALLLDITEVFVPWSTLILSVALYVAIPLVLGYLVRKLLTNKNNNFSVDTFSKNFKPLSIIGLLAIVVILFGFQGDVIVDKPILILLIAIPLIIQGYLVFVIAYGACYFLRVPHKIAAPASLIGTSNFFELAVAVAIGLFGVESGAALATVVGVLVEVPLMLTLVYAANRTRLRFNISQQTSS
jgi:ACR3 family arsenite transporter|tara:strand:- start:3812 stop:4870 length:1059 start_codon:yes stop_codon:yes gene_type:complete